MLKEIKTADRLLRAATRNRKANLSRLITLQSQIKKREELVNTLRAEIAFADSSILRTSRVVNALQEDLDNLEKEYGEIARQAYRQKTTGSKLFFVFSAEGINQAFKRWQYLRQYEDFREKQAELMLLTKETLAGKVKSLGQQRTEKETLIIETEEQSRILKREKSDKNDMVIALQKDERKLRRDLDDKRKSHEQLNSAIETVIQSEMTASRKKARTPGAIKEKKRRIVDPRDDISPEVLERDFFSSKGRLSWPVRKGVITGHYGKQPHPTLKRIEITNNGIDIQTKAGERVYAVFEGEVAGVQYIPGNHYMIIVKHGRYYTVYSNLETVQVDKGDRVKRKEVIGRLHVDDKTNTSQVHFEVWKDKKRMNPVRWIQK